MNTSIIDFLQRISILGKKKDAMEVVYDAEESASTSGMPNYEILKYLNNELKGNAIIDAIIKLLVKKNSEDIPLTGIRMYIDQAIKLLLKGKSPSVAYRNILNPNAIGILKAAEAKGVTGRDIFGTY